MSYEIRNARYNNAAGTAICVEWNHPELGWIPFLALPDDVEQHGREIFQTVNSSGEVAPYIAPTPEELRGQMMTITRRQLLLTLLSIDITEAQVDALLADDPYGMIEWRDASSFNRTHPLIDSLGAQFSITPEQIDSLWGYAQDL